MDGKRKEAMWNTNYWRGVEDSELSKDAYRALEDVVGSEFISDNRAITQGYTLAHLCGIPALQAMGVPRVRPGAIVLPANTEEVQSILRVCNRHKVNLFPLCTGTIYLGPSRSCIILDLKRMKNIVEIDEKNMFAVVEPYVTHAQLQAELMKKGLIHNCPGAGAQCAVLPNFVWSNGSGGLIHRTGSNGQRGALGMEWILPTGEILRLGSLGIPGAGWFDGDGPGPNLRGMIKGYVGHNGGLGVATKVAIKAWPWPGPREFPITGIQEGMESHFPADRFSFHMFRFPTYEKLIEFMYEVGRAEIGATLHRMPAFWLLSFSPLITTVEEFWEEWESGYWQKEAKYVVTLWLMGWSSPAQLEYEEKVLKQICSETEAEPVPEKILKYFYPCSAGEWFRVATTTRLAMPTGTWAVFKGQLDSLDHSLKVARDAFENKKPFIEKGIIADDRVENDGGSDWILTHEYSHQGHGECEWAGEMCREYGEASRDIFASAVVSEMDKKIDSGSVFIQGWAYAERIGPTYHNFHLMMEKFKKRLDPANIAGPDNFSV